MFAIGLENGYIFSKEKNAYCIVKDEDIIGSISFTKEGFHIETDDIQSWINDYQRLMLETISRNGSKKTISVTGSKDSIKYIKTLWDYQFPRGPKMEVNENGVFLRATDKYSLTVISETEVHVTLSREWMHDH